MSSLQMYLPIGAPTSSRASAGGTSLSSSPGGLPAERSGPVAALASRSPRLVQDEEPATVAISGRYGEHSLNSAALQSSLESKLRARLAGRGLPLYVLKWKHWDMQSGPPICALRGSVPRTSVSGSGGVLSGWPTPRAEDAESCGCAGAEGRRTR